MNQTDATQIFHFTNSNINEFVILLTATLIGVFVGFGLVLMLDRKKRDEENQATKKRILSAIVGELKQMEKGLDEWSTRNQIHWDITDHGFKGDHLTLSFGSFEGAKNSGNLSFLPPEIQIDLDNVNNRIKIYSLRIEQILLFPTSAVFVSSYDKTVADNLTIQMNDAIADVTHDLKPLLEKLKLMIK